MQFAICQEVHLGKAVKNNCEEQKAHSALREILLRGDEACVAT